MLLLDEPLGALDLKLRKQMQLELKGIQHDIGITFVHVTHDQEEAMTMADEIAVMNDGRIEQLGAPTELYERPATAFVAGFLGVSNLLAGTVERPGRGPARRRHRSCASARSVCTARTGAVAVGIRPEKIALGGGEDELARPATIVEQRLRRRRRRSTSSRPPPATSPSTCRTRAGLHGAAPGERLDAQLAARTPRSSSTRMEGPE